LCFFLIDPLPTEFYTLSYTTLFRSYLAIIPLIFYRLTFVPMSRQDFSPPYWINMGAVAITALAGSILILRGETWSLVGPLLPFRSEEHTSELQSRENLVCRLLLEKK